MWENLTLVFRCGGTGSVRKFQERVILTNLVIIVVPMYVKVNKEQIKHELFDIDSMEYKCLSRMKKIRTLW